MQHKLSNLNFRQNASKILIYEIFQIVKMKETGAYDAIWNRWFKNSRGHSIESTGGELGLSTATSDVRAFDFQDLFVPLVVLLCGAVMSLVIIALEYAKEDTNNCVKKTLKFEVFQERNE